MSSQIHQLAISSKTNEHYTPDELLNPIYDCLGDIIYLDPCSNSCTEPNVSAAVHYCQEDNALQLPWKSPTLFMNPPFKETKLWGQKLIAEVDCGHVEEAIALTKNDNRTSWYAQLMQHSQAFCLVKGYTKFKGNTSVAAFGVVLWYFGTNFAQFKDSMEPTGWVFATFSH